MSGGTGGRAELVADPVGAWAVEFLAEAVDEAKHRAREEVTARLTRLLVDRAMAEVAAVGSAGAARAAAPAAPTAPAVPDADGADDADDADGGLYVYAITRADAVDLTGAGCLDEATPPYLVPYRDLALVVSGTRLDALASLSGDDLSETGRLAVLARQHHATVRAVFERSPVLPLRFGTVLPGPEAAVRLLRERHDALRARLDDVDGHREWGMRLRTAADAGGETGGGEESPGEPGGTGSARPSGTAYLARRREELARAAEAGRRLRTAATGAHESLARHARECATRGGAGPDVVLEAAYLVATAAEVEFLGEVERLAAQQRRPALRLEVTGPWPPYSFAPVDVEVRHGD